MAIREGLLALLASGERYGYQLKTDFEAITGSVWSLNVGQVYTTLDRLVRDGHVNLEESDSAKVYGITASGRDELARWWQTLPIDDAPPRDELILKVLTALSHSPQLALDVIAVHRTALTELLQQRRRRIRDAAPQVIAEQFVNDAFIFRAEADLRWLDQCEYRLRSSDDFQSRSGSKTKKKDSR